MSVPPEEEPGELQAHVGSQPLAGTAVRHALQYPTRLAHGPEGALYVSDAKVGSVFVHDAAGTIVGELAELAGPLGVAVDGGGQIYVGSRGHRAVDVYAPSGAKLGAFDAGAIGMPNDLALDDAGGLYVVDSEQSEVRLYDTSSRKLVRVLGGASQDDPFRFPSAVAVTPGKLGEVFVADQGNGRIVVFDRHGQFLRTLGERMAAFSTSWEGRFVRLQSIAVDAGAQVYAADSRLGLVQVLDAASGAFLRQIGRPGRGEGELYLPLDIALDGEGALIVADADNHRIGRFDAAGGE